MLQPTGVRGEEIAQVGNAVFQHGETVDAHAERKALILIRIKPAVFENIRMHHAAAENLHPILALTDANFFADALIADVHFRRRLRERKEVRAEPGLHRIHLEIGFGEGFKRALQVTHMRFFIDDEALDLMKHRRVCLVRIATERRQMDEVTRSMSRSESRSESQSGSQSGSQTSSESASSAREAGRRVSDEMNRAEEALNRGDVEEAMVHQQRALNELQRLQRELQVSSNDGTRSRVADVGRAFDELREQEEQLESDITEEIQRLRDEGRNPSRAQDRDVLEGLQDQRVANQEALRELSDQIEELEADVRSEEPSVASALRNMLQRMRREELSENMTNSREALRQGWLDYAERTQDEIQETMGRMEPQRRALDEMMPPSDEERVARALRDAEELQAALDAMQRAAGAQQGPQQGAQGGEAPGQGESNEGSQGEQGAGSQGDRAARANQARLDAERQRALDALERLRQGIRGGDAQARAQLDRLESFLTRADGTGVLLEGEAAAAFFNREAYDPLSQIEMTLMRQMDEIDLEKKLYGARPDDVPPEYRRMVDDYYEALSKDNN